MRYLSLFSGIEAATQAWQPLGWECVAVSEIEPFPCAVLEHHYPHVPNLGDVTKITEQQIKDLGQIDLIVFGSPCQNLSVAGNRKGFEGEQSSLFYAAMEIIKYAKRHCKTRFALWENVPGAFSSNKGADFTEVVKHMAGLDELNTPTNGWGKEGAAVGDNGLLEWSVLDAQWFGLAQRRKRVFAIVDFGEWASRPPILLERHSLRGDSAPSRETGQDFTADVRASTYREGSFGQFVETQAGGTVRASGGCLGGGSETLTVFAEPPSVKQLPSEPYQQVVGALFARDYKGVGNQYVAENKLVVDAIAIQSTVIGRKPENGPQGLGYDKEVCFTLTSADRHAVAFAEPRRARGCDVIANNEPWPTLPANPTSVVRRLTPIECERLQGFPDNFTQIPYRNKSADDCPNGVRYKALGNSMAVNVMAWIGQRVQATQGIKAYT